MNDRERSADGLSGRQRQQERVQWATSPTGILFMDGIAAKLQPHCDHASLASTTVALAAFCCAVAGRRWLEARRATRSWQLVLTERITTFTHRIHACSHDRRPQCAAARVTQCAAPHTAGSSGALERHGFGPSVQKKTKSLLVFLPCPVQHCVTRTRMSCGAAPGVYRQHRLPGAARRHTHNRRDHTRRSGLPINCIRQTSC